MKKFFNHIYILSKTASTLRCDYPLKSLTHPKKISLEKLNIFLSMTHNNIFLSVYDVFLERTIITTSSGSLGYKSRLRKSKKSLHSLIASVRKKLVDKKYAEITVCVKGSPHWLRGSFLKMMHFLLAQPLKNKQIKRTEQIIFNTSPISFVSKISVPFNGCRQPKKKT